MQIKIPFRKVMLAILSIKEQLYKKYKDNEDYRDILDYLMSKDFYYDDETPLPTVRSIKEATDIKDYHIRKRIKKLYENIFEYDTESFLEFNSVVVECYIKNWRDSAFFTFKNIKYIPKVGENITLPFVEGKLSTELYYVESISHRFETDKQIITLTLQSGLFNKYWQIRKSEAKAKREFSFKEELELSDYEMRKKLGVW